ncbi:MAG TPA: GyrI-like domain-containing protein [Fimbriimonadaceae bacterium]|nr:GyrI-like domain-containing protein [Fimbriimonadaceae bacterium]HRJ32021.1 GyrI-like domain-containing protein [Fimbriimonadaceae bacterium]
MHFERITRESFWVTGPEIRTSIEENTQGHTISRFWADLMSSGHFENLMTLSEPAQFPAGTSFGISVPEGEVHGQFTYQVAVEIRASGTGPHPSREIPAGEWAVFVATGDPSDAVPPVFAYIFDEFLPNHPYQLRAGVPELEVYPPTEMGPDYQTEIWIPIEPKP